MTALPDKYAGTCWTPPTTKTGRGSLHGNSTSALRQKSPCERVGLRPTLDSVTSRHSLRLCPFRDPDSACMPRLSNPPNKYAGTCWPPPTAKTGRLDSVTSRHSLRSCPFRDPDSACMPRLSNPPNKYAGTCWPPPTAKTGRGERIRTSGLYVPNVALYQAKLHPVSCSRRDAPLARRGVPDFNTAKFRCHRHTCRSPEI